MKTILLIAAGFLASALGGCVVVPEAPVYAAPAKKVQHHHHHRPYYWRRR